MERQGSTGPLAGRRETSGLLGRLARNRAGNTMALMAASIAPLLALIGGGIDMSRGYLSQVRLQQACDSGVLAARKKLGTSVVLDGTVPDAVADVGNRFFDLNFADACAKPCLFKPCVRHADITDRQVEPGHVRIAHHIAERHHTKAGKFMVFDQGHHRGCIPARDFRHIKPKVAAPGAAGCMKLLLARTEGKAQLAHAGAGLHFGNLQGMAVTGAHGLPFFLFATRYPIAAAQPKELSIEHSHSQQLSGKHQ